METFSILYWICCHPYMQYDALFQHSTTTIPWRQGSCLQGRGSKQIRNLLAGARSWLPLLFFWSLKILRGLVCGFYCPNYLTRFERSSCGCVSPFGFLLFFWVWLYSLFIDVHCFTMFFISVHCFFTCCWLFVRCSLFVRVFNKFALIPYCVYSICSHCSSLSIFPSFKK